jgi:hypothetical protein
MKTIKLLHGVLHVPSPSWAPTVETIAALPVPSGDRSIRVVRPGEVVELSDTEAAHLIARGVAMEVAP